MALICWQGIFILLSPIIILITLLPHFQDLIQVIFQNGTLFLSLAIMRTTRLLMCRLRFCCPPMSLTNSTSIWVFARILP